MNEINVLKEIWTNKNILLALSIQDFKQRYKGNYLGIVWAFIGPLVNIIILWFIFEVGFRSTPAENLPFILWLLAGMVPWLHINECISQGAISISEKSYLVKKIRFGVASLPIVKILVAIFIHLFFLAITFILYLSYGQKIKWTILQIPYYIFSATVLATGISLITASIVVFVKDLSQVIQLFLQFGFWLTPVFWSYKILPTKYHIYIQSNPAYYIVEGYRDSFISGVWFWERPYLTLYYWCFTILVWLFGIRVYRKLRPYFADVL